MLQVKQRAILFSKTTCSYACVASWQYSFYNTTARLIHLVLLYLDLVTSIRTFYKLHSFCNTLYRLIPPQAYTTEVILY